MGMNHFLKNIRVFGKISEKGQKSLKGGGAKDFFHFLVGETHKLEGKYSGGDQSWKKL